MNTDKKRNVPVPCGKCPECLARRVSSWSFRLLQEDKASKNAQFITLTYDTKHVPITRNGFMSLRKSDVQKFFKRLRKSHVVQNNRGAFVRVGKDNGSYECDGSGIKYYAVGEYGTQRKRPHYHILLFNSRTELIQNAWGLGEVNYGNVEGASIGYCLKYMTKPFRHMHKNDDREPHFSLMSKGLGLNYLTEQMIHWHRQNDAVEDRCYCTLPDGKKITMPRYYKDRIYFEEERKRIAYFGRIKQRELEEKELQKNPVYYYRDKSEKDMQEFKRLEYHYEKGRDQF